MPGPIAYYMDDTEKRVSLEVLESLGVQYWNLDPSKYENDPKLDAICKEQGYSYRDYVDSTKIPNLQDKLDSFLIEHIHDDDEIRYFLGGSGYFDVRHCNEAGEPWLRCHLEAGDMITLPKGIYHRFVPDEKCVFHVMRLFQGEPVWTAHNRSDAATGERPARAVYDKNFVKAQ
jgi:1,2-dihydroxy-3-keto-5-methylthiopentene dioxygenase